MKNFFRTDYRLWGLLTFNFFIALVVAEYEYSRNQKKTWLGVLTKWIERDFEDTDFVFVHLGIIGFGFLVLAAGLAWLFQALLLGCGAILSRRPKAPEAIDYDE